MGAAAPRMMLILLGGLVAACRKEPVEQRTPPALVVELAG
jgi:hypothetical protein